MAIGAMLDNIIIILVIKAKYLGKMLTSDSDIC